MIPVVLPTTLHSPTYVYYPPQIALTPTLTPPRSEAIIKGVLKSVKSPRSQLCKAAVLAVADLLHSLKGTALPYFDIGGPSKPATSLLSSLLIKGVTDKKFVQEAVTETLSELPTLPRLDIALVLPQLLAYTAHKNPKVRAYVAATCVGCVQNGGTEAVGGELVEVLKAGVRLVVDKTPEARDAGR